MSEKFLTTRQLAEKYPILTVNKLNKYASAFNNGETDLEKTGPPFLQLEGGKYRMYPEEGVKAWLNRHSTSESVKI